VNRDDIINLALEAGIKLPDGPFPAQSSFTLPNLIRFAAQVAAAEREACLEIADQCANADMHASMAANAIRERSKQ
jgi:hypothetical protein